MSESESSAAVELLVSENCHLLEQGINLIESLPESTYRNNEHEHFSSGVGRHFRHILDFYDRFLTGANGLIDYDSRSRDPRTETEPVYATERTQLVMDGLSKLAADSGGGPVKVRVETCDTDGVGLLTSSSAERELAQLASHTVHHYAIIAMVLSVVGVSVPAGFGVAPSTLRHEKRLSGQ
jgi:hypothetical protein